MISINFLKQATTKQTFSLFSKLSQNISSIKERQKYFIVEYKYVQDTYYKRIPYRQDHDKWVQKMEEKGNQIVGGSYFPLDGATIIFNCDEQQVVENFVKNDVYVKQGLVENYKITEIERKTKDELQEISKIFGYK
ncbi:YCII-like protein (macronuclear) [Tetrahymena thermophila SB210]|uniref:YCII-like protein n=1 Tax=Tetrahymena thermophila (strain SB210) TaxID=312017 RepID=I7LTA5_TETTS|nr:YCII-like protein [Tetrahymena thermophila SB210]EAR84894.3 YCII-like protein [Tetrahymena thermophila SB210]|eukprot:XP_001032557.3 YCII-like protein [Tetrahymena thermophila SB210]